MLACLVVSVRALAFDSVMRRVFVALVALTMVVFPAEGQEQARRVAGVGAARRLALVIGNQSYLGSPLRSARADAESMGSFLSLAVGFTEAGIVPAVLSAGMQHAIRKFVQAVRPGDLLMSDHGRYHLLLGSCTE